MKWKYFVIINLLCMFTIGYFSFHVGKMVQSQTDIKEFYEQSMQAEAK